MIIGIFGPRDYKGKKYSNYNRVADVLETFSMTQLVSGGGAGIERLGLRFAAENKIDTKVIPPHIQALGVKAAFDMRNDEIIKVIDLGVVFWDGREPYYAELIGKIVHSGKIAHVTNLE